MPPVSCHVSEISVLLPFWWVWVQVCNIFEPQHAYLCNCFTFFIKPYLDFNTAVSFKICFYIKWTIPQYRCRSIIFSSLLPSFPSYFFQFLPHFFLTVECLISFHNHRINTPLGNDANGYEAEKRYSSGVWRKVVCNNQRPECQSCLYWFHFLYSVN